MPINLEGNECRMQLDTVMQTYTKQMVVPEGKALVKVTYNEFQKTLPLMVVSSGNGALFGRDWLQEIKLDWKNLPGLSYVSSSKPSPPPSIIRDMDTVLSKYSELFEDSLGHYEGNPVELKISSQPKFHKARPVPYALQAGVEKALDKMETDGIIKKVATASSAAPIVAVKKKNSEDIRICGDFSVTYNACAELVRYPIPKIEDLHAALRGCTVFSVLDMKSAYHQIPVAADSQKHLTINTLKGLYVFTRLPFGIHSAPGLFQQIMDTVLAGIPKVICYLDDILLAGVNEEDHEQTLVRVFDRLQEAGFRLSRNKFHFKKKSVQYLGHVIDAEELHPTQDKLQAIRKAPAPEDVSQLRSFLGLILFYARFIDPQAFYLSSTPE